MANQVLFSSSDYYYERTQSSGPNPSTTTTTTSDNLQFYQTPVYNDASNQQYIRAGSGDYYRRDTPSDYGGSGSFRGSMEGGHGSRPASYSNTSFTFNGPVTWSSIRDAFGTKGYPDEPSLLEGKKMILLFLYFFLSS